jgi:hypothetical protein
MSFEKQQQLSQNHPMKQEEQQQQQIYPTIATVRHLKNNS